METGNNRRMDRRTDGDAIADSIKPTCPALRVLADNGYLRERYYGRAKKTDFHRT